MRAEFLEFSFFIADTPFLLWAIQAGTRRGDQDLCRVCRREAEWCLPPLFGFQNAQKEISEAEESLEFVSCQAFRSVCNYCNHDYGVYAG